MTWNEMANSAAPVKPGTRAWFIPSKQRSTGGAASSDDELAQRRRIEEADAAAADDDAIEELTSS